MKILLIEDNPGDARLIQEPDGFGSTGNEPQAFRIIEIFDSLVAGPVPIQENSPLHQPNNSSSTTWQMACQTVICAS